MDKRGAWVLALVLCAVFIQMVSALSVTMVPYNSTKAYINLSGAVDIYSYEINFNYNATSTTVQQYNFLGTSPTATYGKATRNGIVSVYGSRLDSGLSGISGSGRLFNISHNGNLSLLYDYYILNDSSGVYGYYNTSSNVGINIPGNTTYGYTALLFNVTLSKAFDEVVFALPANVIFSLDAGITNYTANRSSDGYEFTYNYTNITSGTNYLLSIYANDSNGNRNYTTSRAFRVYVTPEVSCGDLVCNGDETCSSCVGDCGACSSGGSGGGGGGGGSVSTGTAYTLELDTLARGIEKALKSGDSYKFKVEGATGLESYSLRVASFNSTSANVVLSTGEIISLEYGSIVNIDLNGDGLNDISLETNAVDSAVSLAIQSLTTTVQCASTGCTQQITKEIFSKNNSSVGNGISDKQGEENVIVRVVKSIFDWFARLFGWN